MLLIEKRCQQRSPHQPYIWSSHMVVVDAFCECAHVEWQCGNWQNKRDGGHIMFRQNTSHPQETQELWKFQSKQKLCLNQLLKTTNGNLTTTTDSLQAFVYSVLFLFFSLTVRIQHCLIQYVRTLVTRVRFGVFIFACVLSDMLLLTALVLYDPVFAQPLRTLQGIPTSEVHSP